MNLLNRLMQGEAIDEVTERGTRVPTFEEFAWQWFETYVKANNKPSEQRTKESTLRLYLVPTFGHLKLDEVSSWYIVNVDAGILTVRQSIVRGVVSTPKSGRMRHLPLDPDVHEVLMHLPRHPITDLVFPRGNGEPLSDRMCAQSLSRVCRRAGVRHIGWHALRHTFATQLLEEREPIRNIQLLLGHSSLSMTERYTHVLPDRLRGSITALAARQRRILTNFGHPVGIGSPSSLESAPTSPTRASEFSAQQSKEHRLHGVL